EEGIRFEQEGWSAIGAGVILHIGIVIGGFHAIDHILAGSVTREQVKEAVGKIAVILMPHFRDPLIVNWQALREDALIALFQGQGECLSGGKNGLPPREAPFRVVVLVE